MKQVLSFYSTEKGNDNVMLTNKTHGKVLKKLTLATKNFFKEWVNESIQYFVYTKNANTPDYEKGLVENNAFRRKVESYLSNIGNNEGEIIEYNFTPSEYMDIKYIIPVGNDDVIKVEIKGFEGDDGELNYEEKCFLIYISESNVLKNGIINYDNSVIDIKRKLIDNKDIDIFKNVYKYAYTLSLSEFICRRAEAYIDYMTENLDKIKDIQKQRKLLLEEHGLPIRGVKVEN